MTGLSNPGPAAVANFVMKSSVRSGLTSHLKMASSEGNDAALDQVDQMLVSNLLHQVSLRSRPHQIQRKGIRRREGTPLPFLAATRYQAMPGHRGNWSRRSSRAHVPDERSEVQQDPLTVPSLPLWGGGVGQQGWLDCSA
jgi:hypothetical protein